MTHCVVVEAVQYALEQFDGAWFLVQNHIIPGRQLSIKLTECTIYSTDAEDWDDKSEFPFEKFSTALLADRAISSYAPYVNFDILCLTKKRVQARIRSHD